MIATKNNLAKFCFYYYFFLKQVRVCCCFWCNHQPPANEHLQKYKYLWIGGGRLFLGLFFFSPRFDRFERKICVALRYSTHGATQIFGFEYFLDSISQRPSQTLRFQLFAWLIYSSVNWEPFYERLNRLKTPFIWILSILSAESTQSTKTTCWLRNIPVDRVEK